MRPLVSAPIVLPAPRAHNVSRTRDVGRRLLGIPAASGAGGADRVFRIDDRSDR